MKWHRKLLNSWRDNSDTDGFLTWFLIAPALAMVVGAGAVLLEKMT